MKKTFYTVLLCCMASALSAAPAQDKKFAQALENAFLQSKQSVESPDTVFDVPSIHFNGKIYSLLQSYSAGQSWVNEYKSNNELKNKSWSDSLQITSDSNPTQITYTQLISYAKRQINRIHPLAVSIDTWYENEPDNTNALVVFRIITETERQTFYTFEIHRLLRTENTIDDCVYSLSLSGPREDNKTRKKWNEFTESQEPAELRKQMEKIIFPTILKREYTDFL